MAMWNVELRDSVYYESIEAESKEEALELAYEYWSYRVPDVVQIEADEGDE